MSGLEMAQNSQRLQWSSEEVDAKLKDIMKNCYEACYSVGKEYGSADHALPSLVMGANISGFIKVRGSSFSHLVTICTYSVLPYL